MNISSRKVTGSHRWSKLFEQNFVIRKNFPGWSKQAGKIILDSAGQFARFSALDETPDCCTGDNSKLHCTYPGLDLHIMATIFETSGSRAMYSPAKFVLDFDYLEFLSHSGKSDLFP